MTLEDRRIATYDDTGKLPVERLPDVPIRVVEGLTGKSAYEVAVDSGFTGTEQEWLASLRGAPGQDAGSHAHPYAPDSHAIDGAHHSGVSVLPTSGQKNALAGTQGTPGATNPYVTTQDPRLSDARTPTAHAHDYAATGHTHTITEPDVPAAIARDAEVTSAIATHAATPHGSSAPVFATLANGATAMGFGTTTAVKVTPTANATYTTTVPVAGTECFLLVLTSGTTSRTITFGAGFKPVGTLATGTTSARVFVITWISDGTNLYEVSRTAAMAA